MTPEWLNVLLWAEPENSGESVPDHVLVNRFLEQGDAVALALLVKRYSPLVWRVCYANLRHYQDAEDAFQATFLVLAEKLRTVRKRELGNWLYGVAQRICWKIRRSRVRQKRREAQRERVSQADDCGSLESEELAVLYRELAKLPQRYRNALLLCDLQGMTRQAAAKALGLAEGTLASRVHRGRQLLAKRLRQAGFTLAAAAAVRAGQAAWGEVPAGLTASAARLVISVLCGQLSHATLPAAYWLARQIIRSMTMTRLACWGTLGAALVLVLSAGLVGWCVLMADRQGTDRAGVLAAAQQNPLAELAAAENVASAEPEGSEAEQNAVPQANYKPSGSANQRQESEKQNPPTADRWREQVTWQNVEVPVAVAVAPDGEHLAMADAYGYVKWYRLARTDQDKPTVIRQPRNPPREPPQVPAQPGGAFIGGVPGQGGFGQAVPGQGGFGNIGNGQGVQIGPAAPCKLVSREERIWDLCFLPDSQHLAIACGAREQNPRVELFALTQQAGKVEWKLQRQVLLNNRQEPRRIAVSPDGKHLVIGGMGRQLASYNLATAELEHDWANQLGSKDLFEVRDLAISPTGRYLAATILWQPKVHNVVKPGGKPAAVLGGGFQDTGTPLRSSVFVFDMEKGQRLWSQDSEGRHSPFNPRMSLFERIAISPDESVLAISQSDAYLVVRKLANGGQVNGFYVGETDPPPANGGKPPAVAGGGIGGGGAIADFARWMRPSGLSVAGDYWYLSPSAPLVVFDPLSHALVTWDYLQLNVPAVPRLWDVKTGKQLRAWADISPLQMRFLGNFGGFTLKPIGYFSPNDGRRIVCIELPAGDGAGFFGLFPGVAAPGQGGQTQEDAVQALKFAVRVYLRHDSLK